MTYSVTWLDADNNVLDLYDLSEGRMITEGALGLIAPPVQLTTSPYVGLDGSAMIRRRRLQRHVVLPIYIKHTTRALTAVAELAAAMQGPGTLTVDDGTNVRSLFDVYYEAGMEGDSTKTLGAGLWRKFVMSLVAMNPWWHDADDTTVVIDADPALAFDDASTAFDAGVGFDGSSETALTIAGDAPAYPTWTIDGPFDALTVGEQGGQSFELAAPLADGDQIIVDSRPGNRGPRLNAGDVDWSLLSEESRLWDLPVGSPVVIAGATGTGVNSAISVSYRQRWLTP